MPLCNAWRQIYLRSPVLDTGGKTGELGENRQKQVWTANALMAPGLGIDPWPIGA